MNSFQPHYEALTFVIFPASQLQCNLILSNRSKFLKELLQCVVDSIRESLDNDM